MKWVIEYDSGIINENEFFFNSNVKKFYFTDGENQYGFYYKTGMFFINNTTFDFKIEIDNYKLNPFQYKTGAMFFDIENSHNNVVAYNIGYDLVNNDEKYTYTLIIKSYSTLFKAVHQKGEQINEKEIRLQ